MPTPSLLILGISHRTASSSLRDQFPAIEHRLPEALDAIAASGIGEALLLVTCDRWEIMVAGGEAEAARGAFLALAGLTLPGHAAVADGAEDAASALHAALYLHEGKAALRHLFRVASGLDSLIVGEPHVLGQVRAAHQAAAAKGLVHSSLETFLQAAYGAAKRVHAETRIALRPASMAAAALAFAGDLHGDLGSCRGLLLGPSEMGELMATQFQEAGLRHLVVCGPEPRAAQAARRFACNFVPLDDLEQALVEADVVIAALGGNTVALTAARMEAILRKRRRRPVFLVDAAIPPDIDPGVNALDGAYLYDLDDLEKAALAGQRTRRAVLSEAEAIVEAELEVFHRRQAERDAVPAVAALRGHFENLRRQVLARDRDLDAEAATRLLINRLLHAPSEVLRELAASGDTNDTRDMEAVLRRLFRLGQESTGRENEEGQEE